ncbi:E3 ubiquitin-protein ligase UHRF2 [Choanephora cucurbitarum]|uniref:RING-type E3 ubiquitin transferase n=1 Tax=Choanephora cucurbitarum TaxID=101091 RepID=A0A1C7NFZ2_9FUNG|nr:E3 ubiquitin-protein ligase UHRF2 [Choanephora cucurbitarum]
MLDTCLDKKPATLFHTYRVRDKTCVFVHIRPSSVQLTKKIKVEPTQPTLSNSDNVVRDMNVISTPFGDPFCPACKNNKKKKKCAECGCVKCLLKTGDPLICDQCDNYWHYQCAGLSKPPTEQYWYCPDCYNYDQEAVVGKGDAVKSISNMPVNLIVKTRERECVLVPVYHVGKIPGVYCGQSWDSLSLVEEWGVHRNVAGRICGSVYTGAVSLLLRQGIKEDKDKGYEFTISGAGSIRHVKLASNASITKNQKMIHHNYALAMTCDAPLDPIKGAQAKNWRKSQPVRVCRTSALALTNPQFAPKKGIRYDGLYKLVKYWPYREPTTGILIWKFTFRRDDQELPPWMAGGQEAMKKHGLRNICNNSDELAKLVQYKIPKRIQKLIAKDTKTARIWEDVCSKIFWSEYEFLHYLFDTALSCSSNVCPKPIKSPVTTPCGHICCLDCLSKTNATTCFTCRAFIPSETIQVNENLVRIMKALNWAYNSSHRRPKSNDNTYSLIAKTQQNLDKKRAKPIKKEKLHPAVKREINSLSLSDFKRHTQGPKKKKIKIVIEHLG